MQAVKDELLSKYSEDIASNLRTISKPQPRDYYVDKELLKRENEDLQVKIDILNSIVSFEYHPEVRPQNAFSVFGEEGTRNFVIWNEDAMQVLGLTEDSDQEAKDYFEQYKREHPDGFITPDAIERFNQWVTHATGNIILGNRFDLRYVGSSEGSSAFGYGAYFEQNRAVAETYRHYGLKNNGLGDIHLRLKNGTVISSSAELVEDHNTWAKEWRTTWPDAPKDVSRELLELLGGTIRAKDLFIRIHNSGEGYSDVIDEIKEYVIDRYSKGLQSTIAHLQKALQTDLDSFHREDFQYRTREQRLADIEDDKANIARLEKELQNIDETIRPFINSIEEIDIEPDKRGNIYNFEIPEDYELLLWDEGLERQSKQLMPTIRKIVDTINNNPAEFIAWSFAQNAKKPKIAQERLMPIIKSLMNKRHYIDTYERRMLPEYKRLKSILKDAIIVDELIDILNQRSPKIDIHAATGEDLYWTLADLTGTKTGASMYLNSQGISGHKFLDNFSRNNEVEEKTYNFVIWNMDKVQMLGLDPDSDREAIDYFNEHQDRQLGLFSHLDAIDGGERYHQPTYTIEYDELERVMFRDKNGTEYTYKDRENISDFLAELARIELKREQGDRIPDLQEAAQNLIRNEREKLKVYQSNLKRAKAKPDNKGMVSIWRKHVRAQKEYIHRLKTSIPQSVELRPAANGHENGHEPAIAPSSLKVSHKPDNFVSDELIEQFNQIVLHGTGNVISGNRFDLAYVGSNQGTAILGYGAYFTQSRKAANLYRNFGKDSDIALVLKNGKRLPYHDILHSENKGIGWVGAMLNHSAKIEHGASSNSLLADLRRQLLNRLDDYRWSKEYAAELQQRIDAIDSIDFIQFPSQKGNVYVFDIPEDYELLNLDVVLHEQSEEVQKLLRKSLRNFDKLHITGLQLYE